MKMLFARRHRQLLNSYTNIYLLLMSAFILILFSSCVTSTRSNAQVQSGSTPASMKEKEMNTTDLKRDLQQITQIVIDLDKLGKYYHADETPGRKPLVIIKNDVLKEELDIYKFGQPVKFLSRREVEGEDKPFFEFTKIEIRDRTALVEFRYPVEGIAGTVKLSKQSDKWNIETSQIVER